MGIYDIVSKFEQSVAEYAMAKYAVAVNSCTNAILLSLVYRRITGWESDIVNIPKHTYVGIPYSCINAGYKIQFIDHNWKGTYKIEPLEIIDSARRFRKNMFENFMVFRSDTLMCLSFHESKILPIGDGGMILTDDKEAYDALRQMRFDGRTPGLSVFDDDFTLSAFHCQMKPPIAMRGLMLMQNVKDYNEDLPGDYPDLSRYKIFQGE